MEKGLYISTIIIFVLIFMGILVSFLTGLFLVPLVSTPKNVRDEILKIMNLAPNDMILDLGSGNGLFLIEASERYDAQGIGYEISPIGILISNILKTLKLGFRNNVAIVPNDFLGDPPLPFANKIYCYLNPKAMDTILKKLKRDDLDEKVTIFSYIHPFPGIQEAFKLELSNEQPLYIYTKSSFKRE